MCHTEQKSNIINKCNCKTKKTKKLELRCCQADIQNFDYFTGESTKNYPSVMKCPITKLNITLMLKDFRGILRLMCPTQTESWNILFSSEVTSRVSNESLIVCVQKLNPISLNVDQSSIM